MTGKGRKEKGEGMEKVDFKTYRPTQQVAFMDWNFHKNKLKILLYWWRFLTFEIHLKFVFCISLRPIWIARFLRKSLKLFFWHICFNYFKIFYLIYITSIQYIFQFKKKNSNPNGLQACSLRKFSCKEENKSICLDIILFEILFEIITITLFARI